MNYHRMRITAPVIIIIEPAIFFFKPFSLKIFTPRKTLNNVESWNRASAYETFILANTKFVEYCIIPTARINKNWYLYSLITGLCLEKATIIDENKSPDRAHKIKQFVVPVIKIIFFINTASVPEQISASIL